MSLLESCASLLIVCILATLAVPSLIRARDNYQLEAVARQVAGSMQWTRLKAISRNRPCRIRVSSGTSYVVECANPDWELDERLTLPSGFQIAGNASPEFHPRGNAAPAGTLTIRNARSESKRVIVNITGRVRVE
jgi:Tfp pilus assembly protein FimT